jgi:DNA repair exonuclease SbcCD ATPase subunit
LNTFSFPAQQVAAQIVDTAHRLSRSPEGPQPEAVEHLINSTRHLLLSVCPGAVNVLPDPPNEENQIARINVLKEKHARLVRHCKDLESSTKDLASRHEEIVAALTQTIENIMKAVKTDGNPEAAAIAEQAVYVTNAIREKEMLTKELESESELRREREDEILQLRENMLQKSNELDDITQKSIELASRIESLQFKLSHSEANNALSG